MLCQKSLENKTADLALKYNFGLDPYEFVTELEIIKFEACAMFTGLCEMNALDIPRKMPELSLKTIHPNLHTSLGIFLTLPVAKSKDASIYFVLLDFLTIFLFLCFLNTFF